MSRGRKCAPSLLCQEIQRSTEWVKTAGITGARANAPNCAWADCRGKGEFGVHPFEPRSAYEIFECLEQSLSGTCLSRAPQVVGEGFDVGDRIEVLNDEKVEVGDVSPWNINDIIGFDHDVGAQVSHIKNSL